jgi:tRNA pseudouridine65 synthase
LIHESESWLALDKPAGFHTHPPEDKAIRISPRWNAQGIAERQFQRELFPVHRLDRATSGILLFSKKRECNRELQEQFAQGGVRKIYFALVRGEFRGNARIDRPLRGESGEEQPALTEVSACFSFPLPLQHPDGGPRKFTVLTAEPESGRFHQIRRHLSHLSFPLVGDSRHGDRRLNREFSSLTGIDILCLRAMGLSFRDPDTQEKISLRAPWNRHWQKIFDLAGTCALQFTF